MGDLEHDHESVHIKKDCPFSLRMTLKSFFDLDQASNNMELDLLLKLNIDFATLFDLRFDL